MNFFGSQRCRSSGLLSGWHVHRWLQWICWEWHFGGICADLAWREVYFRYSPAVCRQLRGLFNGLMFCYSCICLQGRARCWSCLLLHIKADSLQFLWLFPTKLVNIYQIAFLSLEQTKNESRRGASMHILTSRAVNTLATNLFTVLIKAFSLLTVCIVK